jgi:hypothetical protein
MTDIEMRMTFPGHDLVLSLRRRVLVKNDIFDAAANEIERLRTAVKDAQTLIDNDLVGPWMAKHKLDEILK